jgi:Fe2+ or Zn2+ uptake regulation protein
LTFSKTVIQRIVNLWGLGASAEETVKALREEDVKISLHGVYNIRKSLTAQQMIDELQREQQRDIAKCDTPALKLKYRDLLLAKLMPQKTEQKIEGGETYKVEIIDNAKNDSVPPAS